MKKSILDSGATRNMPNNISHLTDICEEEGSVEMWNGYIVQILKVGTLKLTNTVDRINWTVSVSRVASVPESTTNLLSVSRI